MREKLEEHARVVLLDVDSITPSPYQARKTFSEKEIKKLAVSILQNGLLQPISVRPTIDGRWQLIAGERRLRACKLAGIRTIPAIVYHFEDEKTAALSLLENIQREQLNPFEQARALRELLDLWGCTQEAGARRLGIAQPTLANKLRLLTLTPAQQEFCVAQNLTERHARAMRLPTEELRSKALKTAAQRSYTVQQTEALVERVLSARPKPKRKLMVKDVRIFVNTIEHALKVMTGSGIPATATRNENEEYIEYVVRIPTRPAARPAVQEKQPQATNAGPKEGKTPPSSACGHGEAAAPGGKVEPAPGVRQAQGPQQMQHAEEREGLSLPEPGETALAPQAQKNPRP
ncbi:MAG: ParB/RepB/Spo0J family partition protein [Ruthenibacterium sp.]